MGRHDVQQPGRKRLVHVDVDAVGENTYTHTHTQQGVEQQWLPLKMCAVRWEIPCSQFEHFKRAEL